jgi:ABC-type uncharacterized transport system ATPase subunit
VLRSLKQQGKMIISSRTSWRRAGDLRPRVTVMRRGKVVGELITKEIKQSETRMMVGARCAARR